MRIISAEESYPVQAKADIETEGISIPNKKKNLPVDRYLMPSKESGIFASAVSDSSKLSSRQHYLPSRLSSLNQCKRTIPQFELQNNRFKTQTFAPYKKNSFPHRLISEKHHSSQTRSCDTIRRTSHLNNICDHKLHFSEVPFPPRRGDEPLPPPLPAKAKHRKRLESKLL